MFQNMQYCTLAVLLISTTEKRNSDLSQQRTGFGMPHNDFTSEHDRLPRLRRTTSILARLGALMQLTLCRRYLAKTQVRVVRVQNFISEGHQSHQVSTDRGRYAMVSLLHSRLSTIDPWTLNSRSSTFLRTPHSCLSLQ